MHEINKGERKIENSEQINGDPLRVLKVQSKLYEKKESSDMKMTTQVLYKIKRKNKEGTVNKSRLTLRERSRLGRNL